MDNELYTQVRAVNVPTIQIKQVESQFGAKLVPDSEYNTLLNLDDTLKKYRKSHNGKDPDMVSLTNHPGELFKHMVLNIQFLGMEVPGSYNKPAWFRFRKSY
jgi:hypothetical protein